MTIFDASVTHRTLAELEDCADRQELPRGTILGRYVIIEPIGSGGMGSVYRAYDPQLNRGVALKILSLTLSDPQAAERAKARLIREAQALAQLAHPNVVAVHDVGTFDDDVFIAMELVEGDTLSEWLKGKKRSTKEIIAVMTAAGRGLSAAHKAGLVHRDFKPGNVIVGNDGRVRVLDFGLACAADQRGTLKEEQIAERSHDSENSFDLSEISSDSSPNFLLSPLTNAGGVLGTPQYMAPEQHLGQMTDERTDQFGFCVVLYEALYGKRPFLAKTMAGLRKKVLQQKISAPPIDADVPDWLWQIVRKGLRARPGDRFDTIDSLLDELDKDPEEVRRQKQLARRRKLLVLALILLIAALPVAVWYGLRYRTFQLCQASQSELADVWDTTTKCAIQQAFLGTKKSYAKETWERVEQNLDRYLTAWTKMRGNVCEARWIRGTLSEELFDLRMGCIRKRLHELAALVNVFAEADAKVLEKASQASASLTSMAICADDEALRAPYPLPKSAVEKDRVFSIRKDLTVVEALKKTGKYRQGLKLAQELETKVKSLAYGPVQAEVYHQLGFLLSLTGDYDAAKTTLYKAAHVAGECRDSALVAQALARLAWVVGYLQGRPQDGLLIGQDTQIVLKLSGASPIHRAYLSNILGALFARLADYTKAKDYYDQALQIQKQQFGPQHILVAQSDNNLGVLFSDQGRFEKAQEYYQQALSIRKKALGSEHPIVAMTYNNLGTLYARQEKYDKALENFREALEIRKNALGNEHPLVSMSYNNLGLVYAKQGKTDRALEYYKKSLAIREKTLGSDHPDVTYVLLNIATLLLDNNQPDQALAPLERIVRICNNMICHPETQGKALFALARSLGATGGDSRLAVGLAKEAKRIFRKNPRAFVHMSKQVDAWLEKHAHSNIAQTR